MSLAEDHHGFNVELALIHNEFNLDGAWWEALEGAWPVIADVVRAMDSNNIKTTSMPKLLEEFVKTVANQPPGVTRVAMPDKTEDKRPDVDDNASEADLTMTWPV